MAEVRHDVIQLLNEADALAVRIAALEREGETMEHSWPHRDARFHPRSLEWLRYARDYRIRLALERLFGDQS